MDVTRDHFKLFLLGVGGLLLVSDAQRERIKNFGVLGFIGLGLAAMYLKNNKMYDMNLLLPSSFPTIHNAQKTKNDTNPLAQ